MIDPATGWFEITEIPNHRADYVSNYLEWMWLTRYPWLTKVTLDRGSKFQAELSAMLKNNYGITKKLITTHNPQANSMVEHIHQDTHQLIHTAGISGKTDLNDEFGWTGILSGVRQAVHSTKHTTQQATPALLVFNHDVVLNVAFEVDWQYIKEPMKFCPSGSPVNVPVPSDCGQREKICMAVQIQRCRIPVGVSTAPTQVCMEIQVKSKKRDDLSIGAHPHSSENTPLRILAQSNFCGRAKGKELSRQKITTNGVKLSILLTVT
jgi:hypothetical protein